MSAPAHRYRDDGDDNLGERVASLEATMVQVNGKVTWILGLVSACFAGLLGIIAALLHYGGPPR